MYRLALGRVPTKQETATALAFLANQRGRDLDGWAAVCQAMFGCTEFRFVE